LDLIADFALAERSARLNMDFFRISRTVPDRVGRPRTGFWRREWSWDPTFSRISTGGASSWSAAALGADGPSPLLHSPAQAIVHTGAGDVRGELHAMGKWLPRNRKCAPIQQIRCRYLLATEVEMKIFRLN
jgi:hypothetical protein